MVFYPFIHFVALLFLIVIGKTGSSYFLRYVAAGEEGTSVVNRRPNSVGDVLTRNHVHLRDEFDDCRGLYRQLCHVSQPFSAFGIFPALSIVANFAMMATIIPALVIATETCTPHVACSCCVFFKKLYLTIGRASKFVFQVAIPFVVRRGWWACIAVGLAIGIGALVTMFYKPALEPPNSSDFQLFNKEHILDTWDLDFKYRFPAENTITNAQWTIELIFMFGFKSTDPGNIFDPDNKTKDLSRDGDFEKAENTRLASQVLQRR